MMVITKTMRRSEPNPFGDDGMQVFLPMPGESGIVSVSLSADEWRELDRTDTIRVQVSRPAPEDPKKKP